MNTATHTRPAPTSTPVVTWNTARFTLANTLATRLSKTGTADPASLDAVTILTAAANPARAERMAPRPGEPAVLVARLGAWALRQVDDRVIEQALLVLGPQITQTRA